MRIRLSHFLLGVLLLSPIVTTHARSIDQRFNAIRDNPKALMQWLRAMPKGGDLHNHMPGATYAENLIAYAQKTPTCLDATLAYHPCPARYSVHDIQKHSPLWRETIEAWSLHNFHGNTKARHDHFFSAFDKYWPIMQQHQAEALGEIKERAASQHIHYLELMVMPDDFQSSTLGKSLPKLQTIAEKRDWLLQHGLATIISDAIATTTRIENSTNDHLHCTPHATNAACQVQVRFLYHALRGQPLNQVFAQLVLGFELATRDARYVGINLVMAEEGEIALRDYDKHMQMIGELKKLYPKVKVSLHAGELTPNIVNKEELRFHINHAVHLAQADRIGHGIDIQYENHYEDLLKEMAEKGIAVEINLTSNAALLGVTRTHPFPIYQKHGVPLVLSTDDEGVLRTDLSTEYFHAVQQFHLTYSELKQLDRNSLSYSFLPGESLWLDAKSPVAACAHDTLGSNSPSHICLKFLKRSEKARLQWDLERDFVRFERRGRYIKGV